ncbi:MAG: excinuclease ABC subunit UvrC [Spirochaetes bacterium]|nr:excinuclease ABC subunit UvrC [Spirochaetota bacterium]
MSDAAALKKSVARFPEEPGVYLMKDASGAIIYIGKAASLKKRVSSYFRASGLDIKTRVLVRIISDIEYIITDSEIEALILESGLIRKHRPKFNIQKKDDKRYPYIAVTLDEEYPRVIFTRTVRRNGTRYFGPYTDAQAARNTVSLINSIFKLKLCTRELPLKKNERPCMNAQINKCGGICTGAITRDEYLKIIESAISFLEGRIEPVVRDLQEMMKRLANKRKYERAAELRDMIFDIQKLSETQKVHAAVGTDQDYIAAAKQGNEAIIILFEFRGGVLLGRKIAVYDNAEYASHEEIIATFLTGFYENAEIPRRIVAERRIGDRAMLERYLTDRSKHRVAITEPQTAEDRGIIRLIHKNIDVIAAERYADRESRNTLLGLEELQRVLGLDGLPRAMECFDISNLQGADAVASMVRFLDGRPERSGYRRYKIRGYTSSDDPGMIHEAVARRIQYLANEGLSFPDLMVIDGGRTQLARAVEAAANFTSNIRIISLAKRFEELYRAPGEPPLRLPDSSPALRVLKSIRDEAHRFAITYHRKLRGKKTTRSVLDDIGISDRARKELLARFKSVDGIRNASRNELTAVPGIGAKTAEKIFDFFQKK